MEVEDQVSARRVREQTDLRLDGSPGASEPPRRERIEDRGFVCARLTVDGVGLDRFARWCMRPSIKRPFSAIP
jgi:hypothetical protein